MGCATISLSTFSSVEVQFKDSRTAILSPRCNRTKEIYSLGDNILQVFHMTPGHIMEEYLKPEVIDSSS